MKRPLLVFAHRGEAQSFFKNLSYSSLKNTDHSSRNKIFCFQQGFIILTGSDIKKNEEILDQTITKLGADISHVILMGFAGSLRENPLKYSIGQALFIKRVLATDGHSKNLKLLKQCFYSNHPQADAELITHSKVVNQKKIKTQLGLFAHLVDMELYWQAKVVEQFSLPCFFLKVVSDHADHKTVKEDVVKNSSTLSQKLFDTAKTIIPPAKINHFIMEAKKNKTVKNSFGMQSLLRKSIEKKSKTLIEQLEKKMNGNLSYSNKAKLQECIINDFRKLFIKQNNFSTVEKEVRKKWNLQTNENKIYFKTFLSKKMQKNIL